MSGNNIGVLILIAIFCTCGTEAAWKKLNTVPVCFGARGDNFGFFHYRGPPLFVTAFKIVHRHGWVSCHTPNPKTRSKWGCSRAFGNIISVYITDSQNNVLAPKIFKYRNTVERAWYKIPGYNSNSREMIFPLGNNAALRTRLCLFHTQELRLWYGEDLYQFTEGDNGGRSCADVYAQY